MEEGYPNIGKWYQNILTKEKVYLYEAHWSTITFQRVNGEKFKVFAAAYKNSKEKKWIYSEFYYNYLEI